MKSPYDTPALHYRQLNALKNPPPTGGFGLRHLHNQKT
jgi:hypothetical protein